MAEPSHCIYYKKIAGTRWLLTIDHSHCLHSALLVSINYICCTTSILFI
jgi:hypothetical protein